MRLDYALDGYWLARRRDSSPNTVDDYQRSFKRLCDFVGPEKQIEEISARDLHDFLNHVQSEFRLGKKTLTNVWIALSSLWTRVRHRACGAQAGAAAPFPSPAGGDVHGR